MKNFRSGISRLIGDIGILLYPSLCAVCRQNLQMYEKAICLRCRSELPLTNLHLHPENPLKAIFLGRIKLKRVDAMLFFRKGGPVQQVLHSIKYKGQKDAAFELGKWYGAVTKEIYQDHIFIPIPLHKKKEQQRGFNQSTEFAKGLAEGADGILDETSFVRAKETSTQTKKSREERWLNVSTAFHLQHPDSIENKDLVLVDDMLTTGATTEAAAQVLLQGNPRSISIVCLACGDG